MEKNVKVYNNKLELVEVPYSYEFSPLSIADNVEGDAKVTALESLIAQAFERVKAGAGENEYSRILGALNKVADYFASRSARAAALEGSLSRKKVNAFITAFSAISPYSDITDKAKRREAILAAMRSNTALLATLTADVDEDGEDETGA